MSLPLCLGPQLAEALGLRSVAEYAVLLVDGAYHHLQRVKLRRALERRVPPGPGNTGAAAPRPPPLSVTGS